MPLGVPTQQPSGGVAQGPPHPTYGAPTVQNPAAVASAQATTGLVKAQTTMSNIGYDSANRSLDLDRNYAQAGYGLDRQGLANDYWFNAARQGQQQYRDVDLARFRNDNNIEQARRVYGTSRGTALADYGTTRGRLDANFRGDNRDFSTLDGFLGQQRDFTGKQFGLARQGNQLQFDQASRGARDQAASSGSATSTGYGDTRSELARQLGLADGGARLTRDRDYAGNDKDRADLGSARTRTGDLYANDTQGALNDRDFAIQRADNTLFGANADYKYNTAAIDSVAKEFGLSRQEMESAFNLGMDRLGLDFGTTMKRITEAQQSNNTARKAAGDALLAEVLFAAQSGGGAPSARTGPLTAPTSTTTPRIPSGAQGTQDVAPGSRFDINNNRPRTYQDVIASGGRVI